MKVHASLIIATIRARKKDCHLENVWPTTGNVSEYPFTFVIKPSAKRKNVSDKFSHEQFFPPEQ